MEHSGQLPDQARPTDPAVVPSTPERLWHSIATNRCASSAITSAALRDLLCAAESIPADEADRRLEARALSTGLVRIDETWFGVTPGFELPLMPRASYERIVRALRAHIRDCDGDRVGHGGLGNHGAARALASEVAATIRTLEFIETQTRQPS